MSADVSVWFLRFVVLLILGWLAVRSLLIDRLISRLFSENETELPDLKEINERLFDLNFQSTTVTFSAERRANLSFKGKPITLVYGTVASCGFIIKGGGSRHSRLFAIAEQEQADWMLAFPDIFQLACDRKPLSIFWVNAKAFEKLYRK